MVKRQRFSKAFKLEAVRIQEQGDKSAAELALDLGVRCNQLFKWQEALRKSGE